MREGIGSIFLYNIMILFIVIIFAFLAGTVSYSKAFRVNSKIVNAIEKYEGYNDLAASEINRVLKTLGYKVGGANCKTKDGAKPISSLDYAFCVYYLNVDAKHYRYGVMTYLYLDLPLIGNSIKLPVYSKTERIYKFS